MKTIFTYTLIAVIFFGVAIWLTSGSSKKENTDNANSVSIVDGKQIIQITAKGKYLPKKTVAKAGMPTILKVNTNGTFDCTSALRIPSMNLSKNLPPSGVTDIDLGNPKVGTLHGVCEMGMYSFDIEFQS